VLKYTAFKFVFLFLALLLSPCFSCFRFRRKPARSRYRFRMDCYQKWFDWTCLCLTTN